MSELKELSWQIQESVRPLPFEALERRGVRRRHRRQALTGAGVVAVATIAVLAVIFPVGSLLGSEKAGPASPPPSIPVNQAAEDLLKTADAELGGTDFAGPNSWASTWTSFYASKLLNVAVLSRDGVRTAGPVREKAFTLAHLGGDPIAFSGPSGDGGKTDPSWAQAVVVRLTAQGKVEKPLRWAAPSPTFGAHEVLTSTLANHDLLILNPDEGTLRKLVINGAARLTSPVHDSTGRWWVVGEQGRSDGYVYWTDDGGESWGRALVEAREPLSAISVSSDGNSLVAFSPDRTEPGSEKSRLRLSTDRGLTWALSEPVTAGWTYLPIPLNDGRVVQLGGKKVPQLVTLKDSVLATLPNGAGTLTGSEDLLISEISPEGEARSTKVAISTDLGKTWKTFEPR